MTFGCFHLATDDRLFCFTRAERRAGEVSKNEKSRRTRRARTHVHTCAYARYVFLRFLRKNKMSHLSTTFSTPLFPIIAHFSCPSTDNLKTREQRPPKLAFKSSNPNTADSPRLGLEYVSMHSRESDSGQLNRYSLGIAEADPFVVVLAFFFFRVVGNVFTSNDDDAPFSNANDVHERTTFGVRVSGMEAFSAALGLRLHDVFSKKKMGEIWNENVA